MDRIVSVIIPCYNGEKFIDQSIESVYIQDYTPIELIVVDDESTDGSAARINAWKRRFAEKGHTLKYVYQKNRGLGGAIDTGLKHVTGEYLTLLDADDVFLPGAIRKKAAFLDENPDYAGVRNNGWRVSGDNRSLFTADEDEKQITDLFTALTFGKTYNWAGSYMVRTTLLFEAYPDRNMDPSRLGQNFQILLPVSYGRKFGYIDEPLMEYRIQPNSHAYASDPEVQYQKSLINSTGWRDIYRNTVNRIVSDTVERDYYFNAYNSVYDRAAMGRAIAHGKREDIRAYYGKLKKTGYLTLDDRIEYANTVCRPIALVLRAVRKVQSVIRRGK
jgi:glycosyltransferase involved in cell wall biosynthesis